MVGIILAAAGVGIAAGLGITLYQNSQESSGASAAVLPVAVKAPTTLPWTHTPEDELLVDETVEVEPGTEDSRPSTPPPTQPPARAEVPDKTETQRDDSLDRNSTDDDDRVANADRRKREREQRRNRRNQQRDDDLPQDPLKRSTDEINRIREIFEGPSTP